MDAAVISDEERQFLQRALDVLESTLLAAQARGALNAAAAAVPQQQQLQSPPLQPHRPTSAQYRSPSSLFSIDPNASTALTGDSVVTTSASLQQPSLRAVAAPAATCRQLQDLLTVMAEVSSSIDGNPRRLMACLADGRLLFLWSVLLTTNPSNFSGPPPTVAAAEKVRMAAASSGNPVMTTAMIFASSNSGGNNGGNKSPSSSSASMYQTMLLASFVGSYTPASFAAVQLHVLSLVRNVCLILSSWPPSVATVGHLLVRDRWLDILLRYLQQLQQNGGGRATVIDAAIPPAASHTALPSSTFVHAANVSAGSGTRESLEAVVLEAIFLLSTILNRHFADQQHVAQEGALLSSGGPERAPPSSAPQRVILSLEDLASDSADISDDPSYPFKRSMNPPLGQHRPAGADPDIAPTSTLINIANNTDNGGFPYSAASIVGPAEVVLLAERMLAPFSTLSAKNYAMGTLRLWLCGDDALSAAVGIRQRYFRLFERSDSNALSSSSSSAIGHVRRSVTAAVMAVLLADDLLQALAVSTNATRGELAFSISAALELLRHSGLMMESVAGSSSPPSFSETHQEGKKVKVIIAEELVPHVEPLMYRLLLLYRMHAAAPQQHITVPVTAAPYTVYLSPKRFRSLQAIINHLLLALGSIHSDQRDSLRARRMFPRVGGLLQALLMSTMPAEATESQTRTWWLEWMLQQPSTTPRVALQAWHWLRVAVEGFLNCRRFEDVCAWLAERPSVDADVRLTAGAGPLPLESSSSWFEFILQLLAQSTNDEEEGDDNVAVAHSDGNVCRQWVSVEASLVVALTFACGCGAPTHRRMLVEWSRLAAADVLRHLHDAFLADGYGSHSSNNSSSGKAVDLVQVVELGRVTCANFDGEIVNDVDAADRWYLRQRQRMGDSYYYDDDDERDKEKETNHNRSSSVGGVGDGRHGFWWKDDAKWLCRYAENALSTVTAPSSTVKTKKKNSAPPPPSLVPPMLSSVASPSLSSSSGAIRTEVHHKLTVAILTHAVVSLAAGQDF